MPVSYRKGKGSCKEQPCISTFGEKCEPLTNLYTTIPTNSYVIQNNFNQQGNYYTLGPEKACYKPWYNHTIGYVSMPVGPCPDTTNYCN